MRIIKSIASMQRAALQWRSEKIKIGFVPTMGYLHDGHMSLVREARKRVGSRGVVVVSIYVNPTQFAPHEDLTKYPRDLPRDTRMCRNEGVDVVFVPHDEKMYAGRSEGHYSTYVNEELLCKTMEGQTRPTHFRGVTTVVAKLFNIVLPDVAVFGAKDYQQAAIIRRMTKDLSFFTRIIVAPTRREADGLAMSSRNKYLTPEQRTQALCLWQAIQAAKTAVKNSKTPLNSQTLKTELLKTIRTFPAARPDYIEFFDPDSLKATDQVQRGTHMALAVYVGKTRLIDNARMGV